MKRIPGLKKLEHGAYLYKKRYYILLRRIRPHSRTRWYARLYKGDDLKTLAEGDILPAVIYRIECLEKEGGTK